MTWSLAPRRPGERALVAAAYLGAVLLFLLLQEVGLRLRREEHRDWWAGTGRDLLNATGFSALGGALWIFGFPAPAALLLSGTLTLVLFGGSVFFATQTAVAHPRAWATAIGLLAATPVVLWPGEVLSALAAAMELLFER